MKKLSWEYNGEDWWIGTHHDSPLSVGIRKRHDKFGVTYRVELEGIDGFTLSAALLREARRTFASLSGAKDYGQRAWEAYGAVAQLHRGWR